MYRFISIALFLVCIGCNRDTPAPTSGTDTEAAYQRLQTVVYDGISVDVHIDKPAGSSLDVVMIFHGTVWYDSLIHEAAYNMLTRVKDILHSKDMLLISVAYPQEDQLLGDNIRYCEAALLWLQNQAADELGIAINKVFLVGHSQGGYMVTRLNTMHPTDGVIANAPGPLNLEYRCHLEEEGTLPPGYVCSLLYDNYGSTQANATAYLDRSLVHYVSGHQSDILFVQGMEDSPIQMHLWPTFKDQQLTCSDCADIFFREVPVGHQALFHHPQAISAFNIFIENRR